MSNDLADEQPYVSVLYQRLDDLREQAADRLAAVLAERTSNHQQLSQRDATSTMYVRRIAHYDAVENGLCFGRLDFVDGTVVLQDRGLAGRRSKPECVDGVHPDDGLQTMVGH